VGICKNKGFIYKYPKYMEVNYKLLTFLIANDQNIMNLIKLLICFLVREKGFMLKENKKED
jgi:hypothetical protein